MRLILGQSSLQKRNFSSRDLFQLGVGKEERMRYIGRRYLFQLCVGGREKNIAIVATSFCESIFTNFFLPWESDVGASCIRKKTKQKVGIFKVIYIYIIWRREKVTKIGRKRNNFLKKNSCHFIYRSVQVASQNFVKSSFNHGSLQVEFQKVVDKSCI